jgi:hypothetical protein
MRRRIEIEETKKIDAVLFSSRHPVPREREEREKFFDPI